MILKRKPQTVDVNEEENERPSVAQLCVTEQTCLHLFSLEKTNNSKKKKDYKNHLTKKKKTSEKTNNMINQDLAEVTM